MSNIKDTLTTVFAVLTVIGGAVKAYLDSTAGDINWFQLLLSVALAVGLYLAGKNADGSTKTPQQIAKQLESK